MRRGNLYQAELSKPCLLQGNTNICMQLKRMKTEKGMQTEIKKWDYKYDTVVRERDTES